MSRFNVLNDEISSDSESSQGSIDDNYGETRENRSVNRDDKKHVLSVHNTQSYKVENRDIDQDNLNIMANEDDQASVSQPRQEGGMLTTRIPPNSSISLDKNGKLSYDLGFSEEELSVCCKVIEKIGSNIDMMKLPRLRSLRTALHPLIQEKMSKYAESLPQSKKGRKRRRNQEARTLSDEDGVDSIGRDARDKEAKLEQMDREYINKTQLRAARLIELENLNEMQNVAVPRIPDGAAVATSIASLPMITNSSSTTASESKDPTIDKTFIGILNNPLSCYICRKPYDKLHFFYSQLCPDCAVYNYSKRDEIVDMTNRICLVTGGRTKIGYRCALKLLRCGAKVLVTSRFPFDCVSRYRLENDWSEWADRLQVFAVDFRDLSSVENFCYYLNDRFPYLDAIINNAAQTVRRPASYYSHLLPSERSAAESLEKNTQSDLSSNVDDVKNCLSENTSFWKSTSSNKAITSSDSSTQMTNSSEVSTSSVRLPYEMSQMVMIPSEDASPTYFPEGATDVNGQQVDLRRHNSWTMKLHEISTVEIAEVFAINSIAPTIINAKLKGMLERSPFKHRFIVNVSAMEGKFYRFKTDKHPHTNMAKAALNMQTRTCAQDYIKSNIYMTAVDTGWINDEKPIELAVRHQKKDDFQTPIDEIDAAARVLDPIIAPLLAMKLSGTDHIEPPFGVFLKDYMKSEW